MQRLRENALCAFMAGIGCASLAWLSLYGFAWNDYDTEARPAFEALILGHPLGFLRLAPAYGGSLLERAPFALLPSLWGGGPLAVYRMVALPCLLAAAALGVYLVSRMRAEGRSNLAKAVALAVCVANPITLRAFELGHPEELLGGCLCVAAVLLAGAERPLLAGIVLGLAIANKEWALLAVGPALLTLPSRRQRVLSLSSAVALAAVILAPLLIASWGAFAASAAPPSSIFQPWQLWWFFGHHGPLVHGLFGAVKPGYRVAPAWVGRISHPIVLAAGALLTVVLWLRRGRLETRQAMLALALALLLRCLLDTWDAVYYSLPFVLALLAWEVEDQERPPVLALGTSILLWVSFQWLPGRISADELAAFFLAWSLPLAAWLGLRLSGRGAAGARSERSIRPQEMTVSALERLVRTS